MLAQRSRALALSRNEDIDLELVDELVEASWIDVGPKPAAVRLDHEALCVLRLLRQPAAQHVVQRCLERRTPMPRQVLDLLGKQWVERHRSPHRSIMMRSLCAVKLPCGKRWPARVFVEGSFTHDQQRAGW